jgi:hypothetical protein
MFDAFKFPLHIYKEIPLPAIDELFIYLREFYLHIKNLLKAQLQDLAVH